MLLERLFNYAGAWNPLFYMVARVFKSRAPDETQPARNALAATVRDAIRSNETLSFPFILYLRSFAIDVRRKRGEKLWDKSWGYMAMGAQNVDFETAVSDALELYAPVVALDRVTRTFGAGRVHVDDFEWESLVQGMLRRADSVLLVPSDSAGVIAECRMIHDIKCQSKTVFVMPPSDPHVRDSASDEWARAQKAMRLTLEIELPPYSELGMIFTVGADGKPDAIVELSQARTLNSIMQAFRTLQKQLCAIAEGPVSGDSNFVPATVADPAQALAQICQLCRRPEGSHDILCIERMWRT
jgi:hypothetical protein